MNRFFAIILGMFSLVAYGLEPIEFQLYGINANGISFEIFPYGRGTSSEGKFDTESEGDFDTPEGVRGAFYRWVGSEKKGKFLPVGTCNVRQSKEYTFTCKEGSQLFSGVAYEGQPLDESKLDQYPEAKKLYQSFISKFEYGSLTAFYRCKSGCSPSLPPYLIFVWRGD